MKCLKIGSGEKPEVKEHQCLFLDLWGTWMLFEDYYSTFKTRVEKYVAIRKANGGEFNDNYIREYISK